MAWMIRHSIYWLSRSTEEMKEWKLENDFALGYDTKPAADKASHMTAKMFLDAIKAAWLLEDLDELRAYEETSFEMQEVIACTKKKVLALLQSFYRDIFSVPNYDLINERGDFSICTDDERKEAKPCQPSDSSSVLSSPVSEPATDSTFPAELEAGSLISPVDSNSHNGPPEPHATPSTSVECKVVYPDAESVHAARISTLTDGLHVARLEDLSADHGSMDLAGPGLRENELVNVETDLSLTTWAGFQHGLFSIESSPPHNTAFIPTCVRIFKLGSPAASSYFHLLVSREVLPVSQFVIQPSTTTLVPAYAFAADDRAEYSDLYLCDSGIQPTLRYRFLCRDPNGEHYPWELYGFQGALMGAYFESDYSAASVSLHRCGSQTTDSERFPRIQVWTDFPSANAVNSDSSSLSSLSSPKTSRLATSASSSSSSSSSSSTQSPISSREFTALTSRLPHNVSETKFYIFSQNFIYVLFGPFFLYLVFPLPPLSFPFHLTSPPSPQ